MPKGTSAYQAAWIVEEGLDEDDDSDYTDLEDSEGDDMDDDAKSYVGSGMCARCSLVGVL